MEKTFKYELGKEEGEEAFSGNITFKVKKGLLSKPKADNFEFFIEDYKSIESYSRYNHSYLGVYGRRTNDVSQMDYDSLNKRLTDWLIEYNFHRPHQALDYLTPIEFNQKYQVSGMYPSSTPT